MRVLNPPEFQISTRLIQVIKLFNYRSTCSCADVHLYMFERLPLNHLQQQLACELVGVQPLN